MFTIINALLILFFLWTAQKNLKNLNRDPREGFDKMMTMASQSKTAMNAALAISIAISFGGPIYVMALASIKLAPPMVVLVVAVLCTQMFLDIQMAKRVTRAVDTSHVTHLETHNMPARRLYHVACDLLCVAVIVVAAIGLP